MSQFVRLVLWTQGAGRTATVACQRATAEFFGWTNHFEDLNLKPDYVINGRGYYRDNKRVRGRSGAVGGTRVRICTAESRAGNPSRATYTVRLNSRATLYDQAELAHFTERPFAWMETKCGRRISKEHWEELYQVGAHSLRKLPKQP